MPCSPAYVQHGFVSSPLMHRSTSGKTLDGWEQCLLDVCGYEGRVQFFIAMKMFCPLILTDENISPALSLPNFLKIKCGSMHSCFES